MKNYYKIILLLFIFLTSSCTVYRSYYDFYHHGTESIKTDSDFKYVARNIMGKAKTTYHLTSRRKQEIVEDGLIATAKANLQSNMPLKDNQAYANLSIDVIKTEKGSGAPGGAIAVTTFTVEVVISADVIEYY